MMANTVSGTAADQSAKGGNQGYDIGISMSGTFSGGWSQDGIWIGAAWQKTYPNVR